MKGEAYVFLRPFGALCCGHVGWGFLYESAAENIYCFGSTENIKGPLVTKPGGNNDAWISTGNFEEMKAEMRKGHKGHKDALGYTHYKCKFIEPVYPKNAYEVGDSKKKAGFWFTGMSGNNCADQAYDILKAYGVTLPPLQIFIAPNLWFMALYDWDCFKL